MGRRKPLNTSDNAQEILKDEDIFGGEKIKPMDEVAQPFNEVPDMIPNGTDKDGTEWVGEGVEIDTSVGKSGVFH